MKDTDKYKKLYESLKVAVERLEVENHQLKDRNMFLEQQSHTWFADKLSQQAIIQNAINNANATNNTYLEEIQKLRAELKALKGE